jgi:hypothetical protein
LTGYVGSETTIFAWSSGRFSLHKLSDQSSAGAAEVCTSGYDDPTATRALGVIWQMNPLLVRHALALMAQVRTHREER